MSERKLKVCFVCRAKLDAKKDAGAFVEVGEVAACKKHHGVEKWHAETVKAAEKAARDARKAAEASEEAELAKMAEKPV